MPFVIGGEYTLTLFYLLDDTQEDWDGTSVRVVGLDSDEPWCAITFRQCYASFFGPPNDEALEGHPLYSRGLQYYSVHKIKNSSWVRLLEKQNRVHEHHSASHFEKLKHYVFTFHDSTFECIARGYTIEVGSGSILKAASDKLASGFGT